MKLVKRVNPELFERMLAEAGESKFFKAVDMGDGEVEVFAKCAVYHYLPNPNKDALYTGDDMAALVKRTKAYDMRKHIEDEERACNQPGQDDLENMNANEAYDYDNEGY